jgi:hypothetical protein
VFNVENIAKLCLLRECKAHRTWENETGKSFPVSQRSLLIYVIIVQKVAYNVVERISAVDPHFDHHVQLPNRISNDEDACVVIFGSLSGPPNHTAGVKALVNAISRFSASSQFSHASE